MRFPVLQFGTSRFLQAHVDLFIHEAAEAGAEAGPIAVVASSGNAGRRNRLAAFDSPEGYPVEIRGLEEGRTVSRDVRVTSVRRGLDAAADWAEVVAIGLDADFLVSNVSDAGYAVPEGETVDLAAETASPPESFPGKLLALLAARHRAGRPAPVILPTELVRRNGDVLRGILRELASAAGPAMPSSPGWRPTASSSTASSTGSSPRPWSPPGPWPSPMPCGRSRIGPACACPAATPRSW